MGATLEPRRLLLVEDDQLTSALLKNLLVNQGFDVHVADSAAGARRELDDFDPDVALLDILLGDGPNGVALAHLIATAYPGTAVLFLTRFPDPHAAGLIPDDIPADCGFLRKDRVTDTDYLVGAIEGVLRDKASEFRADLDADHPLAGLTVSQVEILRMVACGMTNSAIARQRGTTASAVEQALSGIFRALSIPHTPDTNARIRAALTYVEAAGIPEVR